MTPHPNGLQFLAYDLSSEQRVFAVVLEIASIARLAHDVVAAAEGDVETLVAGFAANDGSEFIRQLGVPGGRFGQRCRQRCGPALSAFAEIRNAHACADQIEVWDSQTWNPGTNPSPPSAPGIFGPNIAMLPWTS